MSLNEPDADSPAHFKRGVEHYTRRRRGLIESTRLGLLFASVAAYIFALFSSDPPSSLTIVLAGAFTASVGVLIRVWAIVFTESQAPGLLTRGPFRFVRHPRYCGTTMVLAGIALMLGEPIAVAAFVAAVTSHSLTATIETNKLIEQYGATAHAYVSGVPAFFPRLKWIPASSADRLRRPKLRWKFVKNHVLPAILTLLAVLLIAAFQGQRIDKIASF